MKLKTANFFDDVKTYDDYEFNTILTDIPYNLGTQWIIDTDGTYQVKGNKKAGDFMNKWDGLDGKDLDNMFKEMFRVLKYGGYCLVFGLDRQLGPLHYYATKNGFEINQSLYWYFVCNDKTTELLTKRGWLNYKDINKDDKVLTFNKDTETSEWQDVKDIHIYDVEEQEMVRIKNQNVDQLVTPNHRILRKHKTNPRYEYGNWEYTQAYNLLKTKNPFTIIPMSFENYEGIDDKNELYYELLGWIFTDGYFSKSDNGIRISQSKEQGVEKLEELLKEMNIDYSKYERYRDIKIGDYEYKNYKENTYYFNNSLSKEIKTLYPDKIPTFDLLDKSYENRKSLLKGIMNGDGTIDEFGNGTFKKNGKVENFVQALIQTLGLRNKTTNGVVYYSNRQTTELQKQIKTENYTGKVWSITTDNSNYCIRRNGCVSFTGNSNFPKATDVGKMIDKRGGKNYTWFKDWMKEEMEKKGLTQKDISKHFPSKTGGITGCVHNWLTGKNSPTIKQFNKLCEVLDAPFSSIEELSRDIVGKGQAGFLEKNNVFDIDNEGYGNYDITTPSSDLAKVFDGYKYSKAPLKQMVETICVFSKPTKNKSVLDDIMEWSEDVDLLNYSPKVSKKERNMGCEDMEDKKMQFVNGGHGLEDSPNFAPITVKNTHPTLKPINLIYEIAKLFKLPDIVGQKVYVPFSGSGSEVIGLLKAGYNHKNIYACEMNPEYVEISKKRIKHYYDTNKSESD